MSQQWPNQGEPRSPSSEPPSSPQPTPATPSPYPTPNPVDPAEPLPDEPGDDDDAARTVAP